MARHGGGGGGGGCMSTINHAAMQGFLVEYHVF